MPGAREQGRGAATLGAWETLGEEEEEEDARRCWELGEEDAGRGRGESKKKEDEEMEKFFSLLRSIRAMKDGCVNRSKKRKANEDEKREVWTPSFEWEDFFPRANLKGTNTILHPSRPSNKKVEDNENCILDLNLSL
ncbi:hypothetical protein ACLOJK_001337 [Asimina triloba]